MLLYWFLPLVIWALHVSGIALILYTDPDCKNQVGILSGSYNGVCQSALGTAAISFQVVDSQSGCLVTLYPAAKPACPATLNNFCFAQVDKCYDNGNSIIAAHSVDLCDAPAPLPSENTTPSPSSSSSSQIQPPPPASSSEETTSTPQPSSSPPSQTPAPAPASSSEQTTSTPPPASSAVTQASAPASSSEQTTSSPPSTSSPSLSTTEASSVASASATPPPSPEGLTRAETIMIGTLVPILVAIPSIWFAWRTWKNRNLGTSESSPVEGH